MTQLPARPVLDEMTFGPITEALRRDLLVHCYRFTGSLHDAEDLVQETLVKAWRGRDAYRGEAGARTWLRRIATRVCLDSLRHARARRTLPSQAGGVDAVLWLEPLPNELLAETRTDPAAVYDVRESVSLAFLVALQELTARQRAVLILRDVLAMSASETAAELEITVSSANSLLHRARRALRGRYDRPSIRRDVPSRTARLLQQYVSAWEAGDVNALMVILKRDAVLEMPPIPSAAIGAAAIQAFLVPRILDGRPGVWRGLTTAANGGPAVGLYQRSGDGFQFTGIQLLTVENGRVSRVTAYMDAALATTFNLPRVLPGG